MSENVQDLLLESLKSGSPNPDSLLRVAASQIAQTDDPVLRLLGAYLLAQVDYDTMSDTEASEEAPDPELVGGLFSKIEALRQRLGYVAAALGRCDVCWGEDPSCASCRGLGSSGFFWPDRLAYEDLVAPAVARVRQTGRADQAWIKRRPEAAPSTGADARPAESVSTRRSESTNQGEARKEDAVDRSERFDRDPPFPSGESD